MKKINLSINFSIASILIFFYLFNVKLPFFYSTSIVATVLSLIFIGKIPLKDLRSLYLDKSYLIYFGLLSFFCILCLIFPIVRGSYEFSLLYTAVPSFFFIFTAPIIGAFVYSLIGKSSSRTLLVINAAFYIQSCIIFISFLSPTFRSLVQIFQDESQTVLANSYYGGGVRGLALSGGLFFSLSTLFVYNFCILAYRNIRRDISYAELVFIFITIGAALTAGRAALFGVVLYFLSFFILMPNFRRGAKFVIFRPVRYIAAMSFFLLLMFYLAQQLGVDEKQINDFSRFAFEFIYKYFDEGSLSTSSTDRLGEMLYFPEISTFFLGDGVYNTPGGGYYGDTDSGYMRPLLFGGVLFLLYTFYASAYLLIRMLKFQRHRILIAMLIASFALLNIKGEVYFYNSTFLCFLVLIYSAILLDKRHNVLLPD